MNSSHFSPFNKSFSGSYVSPLCKEVPCRAAGPICLSGTVEPYKEEEFPW